MIHLLDIGARGGIHPRWKNVADLTVTEFDADEDTDIEFGALWNSRTSAFPLNITRSVGCSSLYLPNIPFLARFDNPERFDVIEQRDVPTYQLDSYQLTPHFLKLDTQGSELEILRGATKTLNSVIGIEIEVEFAPMYIGQPLFAEVDTFLRSKGFELHDLNRFYWRDLRDGQMRLICGEALYFRRDDSPIAKTLRGLYQVSARQAASHSYQWLSRWLHPNRRYDSDMQIGI